MYMSGTGSIYDQASAANLFGQGAQVTAQGTYVPQPDGTYQLVPHGQAAGALTNYGNMQNPATAGGGMYGSQYGATGPDLNPQPQQPAYPVRGSTPSSPVTSPYGYATSVPQSNQYQDLGRPTAPGSATQSYPQTGASAVLNMGDSTTQSSPYVGASNPSSLMDIFNQISGQQQQQQQLPTSGPPGMNYDQTLLQYLQQAMGQTGSQLDYGAGASSGAAQNSAISQGGGGGGGGGLVNYGSIYQNTPGQFGNGYDPNPLGGMINHTFTSVGGVPVNGAQPANLYASDGPPTQPSTGGSGGSVGFPLPGGSGQGGTIGIPLPTPTPVANLPVGAPGAPPVAPWNQTGAVQSQPYQPAQQTATTPQSWNGVATTGGGISDSLRAMLGANVMGTSDGTGGSYDAIQQALMANPSYAAQMQQQQAAQPSVTPATGSGFNFGGSQTTSPSATGSQPSQSGTSSSSLLALLGGLPQPPNLQITPPTVDASGNFANMPGGEVIRSAIQPVLNSQQIGQLQNQATGQNATQAATAENLARENMASRGFSAGSGALGDTNQQIAAARMMADTQANSQIPINAAKLNNDSMMQQLGLNLQGQQNAISSYGQMSDMLKNNAALGAQTYGLGIQGYNAYQNALNNLMNNQLQSQGLGVQQYGQDVNAYNAQQNAMNNYLQNYLAANQLQLSGNNANYQNWLGLGNLLNNSTATDNQFTSSLLNSLLGAA